LILSIIVAMTPDRVIGNANKMPWHIPEELAYFRKTTLGKAVIMGRSTFQSIGKVLDQRQNIVLSSDPSLSMEGVQVAGTLDAAIRLARSDEAFIIGGASVYEQAIGLADRLYITYIHQDLVGDRYFPEIDDKKWVKTSGREEWSQQGIKLEYVIYDAKHHPARDS